MKKLINKKFRVKILLYLLLLSISFYAGTSINQYNQMKDFDLLKKEMITFIADKRIESKVQMQNLKIEDEICQDLVVNYLEKFYDKAITYVAINTIKDIYEKIGYIDIQREGEKIAQFKCPASTIIWLGMKKSQTKHGINNRIEVFIEENLKNVNKNNNQPS